LSSNFKVSVEGAELDKDYSVRIRDLPDTKQVLYDFTFDTEYDNKTPNVVIEPVTPNTTVLDNNRNSIVLNNLLVDNVR